MSLPPQSLYASVEGMIPAVEGYLAAASPARGLIADPAVARA